MSQDRKWLEYISDSEHEQYFDKEMGLTERESLVDCGAYIRDTLDEYNETLSKKWDNCYCFEADSDIFNELEKHVDKCEYQNVELYNVGCWDKREKLFFEKQGSGSSSLVRGSNGVLIQTDRLDAVLDGKRVTVIKMDIEGAEQNALKGARENIK